MKKVIIYPGRFQPMLSHHAEVFKQLSSQFPDAEIYVGTSDKVEAPKSPFNFKEKQLIAQAHGVPADKVLMAGRPYHKDDYAKYFDENSTIIIFAVGEKDLDRFPFGNVDPATGLDMTVKGEPRPKYYQKINTLKSDPRPMAERGYITLAPTIMTGDEVASASAFRQALIDAPDQEAAKAVFQKQFGNYDEKIFNLIYNKVTGANMTENINTLRRLAGLPVQDVHEAAPVVFNADVDPKQAKFSDPTKTSSKYSIANRFPKGSDVNDIETKKAEFVKALQQSPDALLSEINERLDPRDDTSLAIGQKLYEISEELEKNGGRVAALPKTMKQFVLELTMSAVMRMQLVAGDDSPVYSDDDEKMTAETLDLSDIRSEYGISEDWGSSDGYVLVKAIDDAVAARGLSPEVIQDEAENLAELYYDNMGYDSPEEAVDRIINTWKLRSSTGKALARMFATDESMQEATTERSSSRKFVVWYMVDDNEWDNKGTFNSEEEADGFIDSLEAEGYDSDNFEVLAPGEHPDDEDWIPSIDDFEQEIKHGYRGVGALRVEGFSSDEDQVLAQVGSGELDAYDVMTRPQGPAQAKAAEIIQQMYDDVSIDHGLHPDDDFEKILDIVADQLAADYGDSDEKMHEAGQLDEIGDTDAGKKALGSYVKKAADSTRVNTRWAARTGDRDAEDIVGKRRKGIERAVDKLTNEEVEQMARLRTLSGLPTTEGMVDIEYGVDPKLQKLVDIGHLLRKTLDVGSGVKWDDADFNKAASLADALISLGATFGPKNLKDALKLADVDIAQAQDLIAKASNKTGIDEISDKTKMSYLDKANDSLADAEDDREFYVAHDDNTDAEDNIIRKRKAGIDSVHKSMNQIINPKNYVVTYEESKFGGYRPKILNRKTNSTMYLGQHGYEDIRDAMKHAELYLNAYANGGDEAATDATMAFVRQNKNKIVSGLGEEAKPDFLDLDKDGDTDEPMKKAADDKIDETANKAVEAAMAELRKLAGL